MTHPLAWRPVRIVAALLILAITRREAGAQVAGELRGRITEAGATRAITNGRVELGGRTDIVRTGADGHYVVRGLEPRTYTVTIRALGYATRAFEVDIANGRTTVLDASLEPSSSVLTRLDVRADRDTGRVNAMVFDRTMIEQSGRRDLGELLQTVPGVVITQAGGPGQPSTVSIRGSTSGQVLVLVDGVPLNSALSGGADLSRVPLENVNQVTVRTGAQSARYGPRAMAGVIEIETRRPQHELSAQLRGGALGERDVSFTAAETHPLASLNAGASLTADYRAVNGDFDFTLPPVRGGGRATRINADAASGSLLGALSLDGAFGSVALRGTWQQSDRGMAGSIVQPSGSGRQGHERLGSGMTAQGLAGLVAWTAAADITQERGTFIDATPPFGEAFDDTIKATGITTSASATVTHSQVTSAIGVEIRTLDVRSTMLAPGAPHWQSLVGEWVNVRSEHALAASGFRLGGELSARVDQNSLTDGNAFSPRAAANLSREALSLSLSLGAGYAPPTLSDQFFHEGVQVRANPNLQAERTRNDFEARLSLRETAVSTLRISGEVAAYRSDIDGMILWFPDFRYIWSPSNYDVHRKGWEANGMASLPGARLEVRGGVNRNDVTYAGGVMDGQVAYRPRATSNVQVAFAPKLVRFDITTRYVGTRRTIAGSALNSLAPYWISDARISRSFAPAGWTFQTALSVENALNQDAAMLVDYPFPPRTWTVSVRVRRSISQSR